MGVFYVESPAMRGLFIKLQTDNYLRLVAASSIIRPGVSNGGMKEEYIKRHRFPERRKQAHPVLEEILTETYGVMVYQEDVIKVAHFFRRTFFGRSRYSSPRHERKADEPSRFSAPGREIPQQLYGKGLFRTTYRRGLEADPLFCWLCISQRPFRFLCGGELPKPISKMLFSAGIYGGLLSTTAADFTMWRLIFRRSGDAVAEFMRPILTEAITLRSSTEKIFTWDLGYIKELEIKVVQRILENRNFFGPY